MRKPPNLGLIGPCPRHNYGLKGQKFFAVFFKNELLSCHGDNTSRLRPFVAGPKKPIPIMMDNIAAPIITNTASAP
jgi:hypothetical protein